MRTCWDSGVSTPVCGEGTRCRDGDQHPAATPAVPARSHLEEEGTLHGARGGEAPAGAADSLVLHGGHRAWGQLGWVKREPGQDSRSRSAPQVLCRQGLVPSCSRGCTEPPAAHPEVTASPGSTTPGTWAHGGTSTNGAAWGWMNPSGAPWHGKGARASSAGLCTHPDGQLPPPLPAPNPGQSSTAHRPHAARTVHPPVEALGQDEAGVALGREGQPVVGSPAPATAPQRRQLLGRAVGQVVQRQRVGERSAVLGVHEPGDGMKVLRDEGSIPEPPRVSPAPSPYRMLWMKARWRCSCSSSLP